MDKWWQHSICMYNIYWDRLDVSLLLLLVSSVFKQTIVLPNTKNRKRNRCIKRGIPYRVSVFKDLAYEFP